MSDDRNKAEGVLNGSDFDPQEGLSTRRDVAKVRLMSLSQVAATLNRDRNTVDKWVKQGCPAVQKADRATGTPWMLDISEVVRWLERRAGEVVAEKMGAGPDGMVPEAEGKRRRVVAQAIIAETEAGELLRSLSRWSVVTDRVAADYAELRARLTAIGDAVAGKVERRIAAQTKRIVDEQVSTALAALRVDRDLGSDEVT